MTSRLDGGILIVSSMAFKNKDLSYLSPHQYKKKFCNYPHEKFHSFFLKSLSIYLRGFCHRLWNKPILHDLVVDYKKEAVNVPTITWIGHSTFLIELDGVTIITDPIFGNASPLFRRIAPPGIALNELKPINYILISHNHRDHMDAQSLLSLRHHNSRVLVPKGDKKWFLRNAFRLVEEHTWWDSRTYYHANEPLTFTFLPAHHWSQRSLFDRNRSLWGSWIITYKGYTIYFAGDTAYAPHFKKIQHHFPKIDVALMPIGPCEPEKTMQCAHMNAQQAGQAFVDLGARHFIPMHWGTFYFGLDTFNQPVEGLCSWWKNQSAVTMDQLSILKIGQSWHVQPRSADGELPTDYAENFI
jgi:L-ascorbate metabolism protein UlaG (beta-lactamase superfamily)